MMAKFHVVAFLDDGTCRQVMMKQEELDMLESFIYQLYPKEILVAEDKLQLEVVNKSASLHSTND
jgi:hypothetical protein